MIGSLNFFFHIVGVGLIFAVVTSGWFLNRKLGIEHDAVQKLYLAGILRTIGLFSPVASLLLLITGIGNIHTRYLGSTLSWYSEGWLVAKIMFFAVMLVNGTVLGPTLSRKRTVLLREMVDHKAPENAESILKALGRQILMFNLVQLILLLAVLLLSTSGSGKHPAMF
jgi:hypothetical protein